MRYVLLSFCLLGFGCSATTHLSHLPLGSTLSFSRVVPVDRKTRSFHISSRRGGERVTCDLTNIQAEKGLSGTYELTQVSPLFGHMLGARNEIVKTREILPRYLFRSGAQSFELDCLPFERESEFSDRSVFRNLSGEELIQALALQNIELKLGTGSAKSDVTEELKKFRQATQSIPDHEDH